MTTETILTGSFGVGKSSIFNRLIYNEFSNKYFGTLGVRINQKEITVNETPVTLKVWDIAGEVKQNKIPVSYFQKPKTILYVIDLSRPMTFKNAPEDLAYLEEFASESNIKVVGNKKDLFVGQELTKLVENNPVIHFDWITSALTSYNIEELFMEIAKEQLSLIK